MLKSFSTICVATLFTLLAGCMSYTVMTPQELTRLGTRQADGCTAAQASERAAIAFKTLGYKVTRMDAAAGLVKTAPKVFFVESSTTAKQNRALIGRDETKAKTTVQQDALAWVARSESNGGGATIVLSPRAFRNSVERTGPGLFTREVMTPHFQQVWREIQDELKTCR